MLAFFVAALFIGQESAAQSLPTSWEKYQSLPEFAPKAAHQRWRQVYDWVDAVYQPAPRDVDDFERLAAILAIATEIESFGDLTWDEMDEKLLQLPTEYAKFTTDPELNASNASKDVKEKRVVELESFVKFIQQRVDASRFFVHSDNVTQADAESDLPTFVKRESERLFRKWQAERERRRPKDPASQTRNTGSMGLSDDDERRQADDIKTRLDNFGKRSGSSRFAELKESLDKRQRVVRGLASFVRGELAGFERDISAREFARAKQEYDLQLTDLENRFVQMTSNGAPNTLVLEERQLADGLAAIAAGRTEVALEHFRAAGRINPRNAIYHYRIALTNAELGRFNEATSDLILALEIEKRFPAPDFNSHFEGFQGPRRAVFNRARQLYATGNTLKPTLNVWAGW